MAEVDLGNQVIFDLRFWGKNRICALGEEELLVFDTKGEVLGRYDTGSVTDFDLGETALRRWCCREAAVRPW